MEHGRRTSWTGRPRLRIRVRPPQRFARLLQTSARITGSCDFGPLLTTPASSWRHRLERSSRRISDTSNRFWVKNRTYRKQTIKPCLTGARTHIRIFEILQISAQNDDATGIVIPSEAVVGPTRDLLCFLFENFRAFLPGSAQKVECDVTHSKQTTGKFLPGATTASLAHRKSSNTESKLPEGRAWLRL
jgi:hypothetical protein